MTITATHLKGPAFNPIRSFNFRLLCEEDSLTYAFESAHRPSLFNTDGATRYTPFIQCTFREFVDVDVIGLIKKWMRDGERTVSLQIEDEVGKVVEEYISNNAIPLSISPLVMSYADNDIARSSVMIKGTWVRIRRTEEG